MYTKISYILLIAAFVIFIVMITSFDKGYENMGAALFCMGVIALIVILGVLISIIAIVKERNPLSWISAFIFIVPCLAFAVNMWKELRPHNHESQKEYIKNIKNDRWSSVISSYSAMNNWIPQYFRDENIDVDTRDTDNMTPLMAAAWNGDKILLKWLIERNSDINNQDTYGRSALHFVELSYFDCAKILLENGADVNLKDNEGNTPALEIAKYWNERKYWDDKYWETDSSYLIFQELCKYGADLTIENNSGESVLNILPQRVLDKLKQPGK